MTYILVELSKVFISNLQESCKNRNACVRFGKVYDVTTPFGGHFP